MVNTKKYTEEELLENARKRSKTYFEEHKEEQRERCRENYRNKYFLYNTYEREKMYIDNFNVIFTRLYAYYDNIDIKKGYTTGRSVKQDIKLLNNILRRADRISKPISNITIDYKGHKINFLEINNTTVNNFRSSFCNFKIL